MKTCLRLTLFACLILPLSAAAEPPIQVPNSCLAGNPFTIKIPVKFPENMTVQYAWYRNDTLVEDSHMLLLGEKTIAYTIPANKAFGSAVYHFTYNLHDEHDGEWTPSRRYAITFLPNVDPGLCSLSGVGGIEGDEVDLSCKLSGGGGVIEGDDIPDLSCKLSSGGGNVEGDDIPDLSCKLSSGGGNIEGDEVPDLSCKLSGGGNIGE